MKFFFLLIIIILSCNSHTNLANLTQKNKSDSPINSILGKWGGLEARHPSFEIKEDSIYFFGRSISCPYKIINNNDIAINLPEGKILFKNMYVIEDTIFFIDEGGNPIKGFRFKRK